MLFAMNARAQQPNFFSRSEIGVHAGTMFYIGDLNQFKPFYKSKFAGSLVYRFNVHSRLTLRFNATYGNIAADDKDAKQALMVNRNLNFQSQISEIAGGLEFHYMPFQFGNRRYIGTAYMITQIGLFHMNPQTEFNGALVDLQSVGTEGQNKEGGTKPYGKYQLCVPLGLGVKFSLGKFCSFNLDIAIRKTFTDYIDDIGADTYMSPESLDAINGADAVALSNRSINGSFQGRRGDSSNKDWYIYAGGMLTFRLGKGNNCPVIR
ncbi:MAG: DUF6089 family protein [Crocinitomicaceae bacterium]|nr:DUF6089 family protein [Crocinitomicaceae bacterium]MDG1735466.1 DUF6089 family protein [Crocinitomicaceae bacterium]MDG2506159.1 DUF6089 family protein [Crocinitomicaceae bacterium]